MLQCDSDTNANLADRSPSGTRAFACALTLQAASCTMNWVWAISSAVRAFGLHPKGRPFKSDSAHHSDASPFSGDVVQLVRTLPFSWLESYTVTANSVPYSTERTGNRHIYIYTRMLFASAANARAPIEP